MEAPSPLMAWLWKNEELSDVTVQLCTMQKRTPWRGKTVTARRGSGGASAAATPPSGPEVLGEPARSYSCHTTILASCSPYFKARVTRGRIRRGNDGSVLTYASSITAAASGQSPSRSLLLQERVEEAELDAMEAVLRCCYTGQLHDEGAAAAQLSVEALLQMVVLSDRFDVSPSQVRSCDELVKRAASDYNLSDVDLVLGGLPPGVQNQAAHSQIVAAATERLLQLLGNVEAVCGAWYDAASSLDSQLLHLTLPSLLTLLGSDHLKARSENSVLMMADAGALGPVGSSCSQAQLRQVAEVIRLGQLSPAFTTSVLQHLQWLQLTTDEQESLVQFLMAGLMGDTGRQASLSRNNQLSGPAAWYAGKRRAAWPGPATVDLHWSLTTEELTNDLEAARTSQAWVAAYGPCSFFNGYALAPVLHLEGGTSGASAMLGHSVYVQRAGSAARNIHCKSIHSAVTCEVRGGPAPRFWRGAMASCYVSRLGLGGLAAGGHVLDIASWAPLLVQGKLQLKTTIRACE